MWMKSIVQVSEKILQDKQFLYLKLKRKCFRVFQCTAKVDSCWLSPFWSGMCPKIRRIVRMYSPMPNSPMKRLAHHNINIHPKSSHIDQRIYWDSMECINYKTSKYMCFSKSMECVAWHKENVFCTSRSQSADTPYLACDTWRSSSGRVPVLAGL